LGYIDSSHPSSLTFADYVFRYYWFGLMLLVVLIRSLLQDFKEGLVDMAVTFANFFKNLLCYLAANLQPFIILRFNYLHMLNLLEKILVDLGYFSNDAVPFFDLLLQNSFLLLMRVPCGKRLWNFICY